MYILRYYLRNQSQLFSEPQIYRTDSEENFKQALQIANANGYKIVSTEVKGVKYEY